MTKKSSKATADLRGYTAFTETAEPEDVLAFLRQYHGALGPLVTSSPATGSWCSSTARCRPAARAVKMAMAMREEAGKPIAACRRRGSELGFGTGIAQGYAILGEIFSDRSGYTAIGTVCNRAARLCAEAKDGQILVSGRIAEAMEAIVKLEDLGEFERGVLANRSRRSTSRRAPARPMLVPIRPSSRTSREPDLKKRAYQAHADTGSWWAPR